MEPMFKNTDSNSNTTLLPNQKDTYCMFFSFLIPKFMQLHNITYGSRRKAYEETKKKTMGRREGKSEGVK